MRGRPRSPGPSSPRPARTPARPAGTPTLLLVAACAAVAGLGPGSAGLAAQQGAQTATTDGLTKGQLIRLLAEPALEPGAVADSVRRRCLSFQPAERDLRDLRELGADGEVVSAIETCGGSEPAGEPAVAEAPAGEPTLAVEPGRLTARVGDTVRVRAVLRRGQRPVSGVPLQLAGVATLSGGSGESPVVRTDAEGVAAFEFTVGNRTGRYPLRVVGSAAGGGVTAGLDLLVAGGPPSAARLRAGELVVGGGTQATGEIRAVVRDRFGNRSADVPVQLRLLAEGGEEGEPLEATTGPDGEVRFQVPLRRLASAERMELVADGRPLEARGISLADFEEAALAGEAPPVELARSDDELSPPAGSDRDLLPRVRLTLARTALEAGDAEGAVALLEVAVRQSPESAEAWLALGRAREAAGRESDARAAYRRAAELDPAEEGEAQEALARLTTVPAWMEASVWGGVSLAREDAEGAGGLRAARLAWRALPFLRVHGRYDRSLNIDEPLLVRGLDDLSSWYGGATAEWGPARMLRTRAEIGLRDPDGDLLQYAYRASQAVTFDSREGPATLEVGGWLGRWYERDDWVLWGRLEWPVTERLSAVPALYTGETLGPPYDPTFAGVDRETRGYAGVSYRPLPGVEVRPAVGLGSVDRAGTDSPGGLVDLVVEGYAGLADDVRLQAFLRHQRPPGEDAFTVVAAGFSVGFDPPQPPSSERRDR